MLRRVRTAFLISSLLITLPAAIAAAEAAPPANCWEVPLKITSAQRVSRVLAAFSPIRAADSVRTGSMPTMLILSDRRTQLPSCATVAVTAVMERVVPSGVTPSVRDAAGTLRELKRRKFTVSPSFLGMGRFWPYFRKVRLGSSRDSRVRS